MKICPKCSAQLDDAILFCPTCGAPQSAQQQQQYQQQAYAPYTDPNDHTSEFDKNDYTKKQ